MQTQKTSPLVGLILLMRPQQWVKNFFIFIPAFFAGALWNLSMLIDLSLAFTSFCLAASSIYILNDYKDVSADRNHPEKCKRPLAAGIVSPVVALCVMTILLCYSLIMAHHLDFSFFLFLSFYIALNIGYCFGLKNISILDIFIVASGFLIRTLIGGVVAQVYVSEWLIIMVFLLSMFLVVAKRRDDLVLTEKSGKMLRKSLQHYNLKFLDSFISTLSGIIIVSYLMYTISEASTARLGEHLYFTSIFVLAGLIRYLQIVFVEQKSGSPTKILYKDTFIKCTLLFWLLSFLILIYF